MAPILAVREVTKSFGGLKAVDAVSFDIQRGEIVVIIGPNGAGKTTLFNLISGFMPPDAGDVSFESASLAGQTPPRIAGLGLVRSFQIMQIFPDMSVRDVVTAAALLRLPMNAAVALVERSMPTRMDVADGILVINFGRKVAEGSRQQIVKDQAVRDAYFGEAIDAAH